MTGGAMQRRQTPPTTVSSNGVAIVVDDKTFAPMRDSTDRLGPGELRARFQADGYALLRGVLDRRKALELRASYFSRFDACMSAPGTTAEEGIFSGTLPDDLPEYLHGRASGTPTSCGRRSPTSSPANWRRWSSRSSGPVPPPS